MHRERESDRHTHREYTQKLKQQNTHLFVFIKIYPLAGTVYFELRLLIGGLKGIPKFSENFHVYKLIHNYYYDYYCYY